MIIKYTNFTDGLHDLDLDERAEKLGLAKPFNGEVKLKVRMDKSHSQIVLNCDLDSKADLICDRCGEEFSAELNNKFRLVYLFGQDPGNDSSTDLYYIEPEIDKIKLDEDVKDYAVLSMPMKNLCREDCKGICPDCGKNLNNYECNCIKDDFNPQWAALLKLKNKINK
ncbi:MAG: DUF177 domain-containing protein [Ignavibacteria bacterium]